MSFGEGNKRERIAELEERLAKAKLAIDSLQAENNRLKGENATLQEAIDRMKDVNGALCAEVNKSDKAIRELKALITDIFNDHSESCGMEGFASWPRKQFGKKLVDVHVDIPLNEWEKHELKYEANHGFTRFRDLLESIGIEVSE